jgi:hypothetical protein
MATDITTETESAEELAKRFKLLVKTWKAATLFSSRAGKMAEHPAYREIVAMGDKAVPLILAEMEKNGGHWFIALSEITGANPIPEESCGKIREMEAAWFAWARAKGHRWEHAV